MLNPLTQVRKKTVLTGKRARSSSGGESGQLRQFEWRRPQSAMWSKRDGEDQLTRRRSNVHILQAHCIRSLSTYKQLLFSLGSLIMLLSPYLPQIRLLSACQNGVRAPHRRTFLTLPLTTRRHRNTSLAAYGHGCSVTALPFISSALNSTDCSGTFCSAAFKTTLSTS